MDPEISIEADGIEWRRSGLPTGVSLIGPPGTDWHLLAAGAALEAGLGSLYDGR